jgi:hypothetical protein
MAGHAAGQDRSDGQGRERFGAHEAGYFTPGADGQDYGMARRPDSKGFLGSLFDLGFTSFVTPKVIKVLYLLIMIGTIFTALIYSVVALKVNVALGLATLFIAAPLFTLIVMAIWRISLEFFMVIFRISDDIRVLRDRGEIRLPARPRRTRATGAAPYRCNRAASGDNRGSSPTRR